MTNKIRFQAMTYYIPLYFQFVRVRRRPNTEEFSQLLIRNL